MPAVTELIAASERHARRKWQESYCTELDVEAGLELIDELRRALEWCLDQMDKKPTPQRSLFS